MSEVPSYLYAGLDSETLRLARELEDLGGGDTSVHNTELVAVIANKNERKDGAQTLWNYGTSIGLRDPHLPRGSSAMDAMRCFKVTRCAPFDELILDEHSHLVRKSVDNLLDGFNSTVITFGERQTGKTLSMFGVPYDNSFRQKVEIPKCFTHNLLADLYSKLTPSAPGEDYIVGISAWVLHGQNIIDLCSPVANNNSKALLDFAVVECPDCKTCLEVLRTARSRAPKGCLAYDANIDDNLLNDVGVPKDSQCGHFFFRIILHREFHNGQSTQTSAMHVIDLCGLSSVNDVDFDKLEEFERVCRRDKQLQLQSFTKLLLEMKDANLNPSNISISESLFQPWSQQSEVGINGSLKVTSARDTKLTMILGTILLSNSITTVIIYLKDGERHFNATNNVLLGTNNITSIVNPVMKVSSIKKEALKLKHYNTVLTPIFGAGNLTQLASSISDPFSSSSISKERNLYDVQEQASFGKMSDFDYNDYDLEQLASKDDDFLFARPVAMASESNKISKPQKSPAVKTRSPIVNDIMTEFEMLMNKINTPATDYFGSNIDSEVETGDNDNIAENRNNGQYDDNHIQLGEVARRDTNSRWHVEDNADDNDSLNSSDSDSSTNSGFENVESGTNSNEKSNVESGFKIETFDEYEDIQNSRMHRSQSPSKSSSSPLESRSSFEKESHSAPAPREKLSVSPERRVKLQLPEESGNHEVKSPKKIVLSPNREPKAKPMNFIHSNNTSKVDFKDYIDFTRNDLVNEIQKLESTHVTLLESLQQEKRSKEKVEKKMMSMQEEMIELRTQCDVEISSYKVDVIRLKAQIRTLSEHQNVAELYNSFEETVQRLLTENEALRKRNLQLESKDVFDDYNGQHRFSGVSKSISDIKNAKKYKVMDKLKQVIVEKEELKHSYEELLKKERQFIMSHKLTENLSSRLRQSFHELRKSKAELDQEKQISSTREAELIQLRTELDVVQKNERALRAERSRNLSELSLLRERVRDLEDEKRKTQKMSKLVDKHVPVDINSFSRLGSHREQEKSSNKADSNNEIGNENYSSIYARMLKEASDPAPKSNNDIFEALSLKLESDQSLNPELETVLTSLHETIIAKYPLLLPLYRRLSHEIYGERLRVVDYKNRVLALLQEQLSTLGGIQSTGKPNGRPISAMKSRLATK